ncbi:hypothetical protein [Burkholderia ubonensis]|uniref:hypothetical protein n=1 Tax=Burkholderia ubonensis TaxID=101571 RepID=UPI000A3FBD8F|nr:hypothetical protein [Burkholderia ubonensis]
MSTENKKSPTPEQASEAVPQRQRTENPTAEAIFEQASSGGNLICSKFEDGKSRADALTDDAARKIAHRIYCRLGLCGSNPLCFNGADATTQQRWISAIKDACPLFAASPVEQPAAAPAIELSSVKETLESGGGFWRTCSGCHESEDGHPVGEYPYSEVLQCDLGAGCTECGGIGAVWDNTDYDDMAAFLDRQEEAAEASQSAATPADERAAFIEAYVRTLPPENRAVDPGAAHRFAESVIEACGPGWQLWLAGIAYARAASANETGAEDLDGLAHELWSAAQTQPRQLEGIEDGVRRIKAILSHSPAMAAEAVATRVEWDQDAAIEALSDFPKGSIWYEFLEEVGFDPTSGPIYVLTVQGRAMLDQLKSAYFAAPQPAQADAPATIPDECVANGASCSYAPEGRHGEMQCRYCGKAQADALDEEQRDALNEAICWANDDGLPGTADQLRSILALHEQADAPAEAREPARHEWDATGERCVKCGDKDWFADPHCSESRIKGSAPADAGSGDAIARSKRILALVDDYHEKPTADSRTALRKALMDEFAITQPASMGASLTEKQRAVIERAISEVELSCQYELANELRALLNGADHDR